MTSLVARLEHRQQQKLSPRLQQAVKLLQLSSLDFNQEIQAMLDENPFLEDAESDESGDTAADSGEKAEATDESLVEDPPLDIAPAPEESAAELSDLGDERDPWQSDGRSTSSNAQGEGSETNPLNLMAAESSLSDHLHGQLNLLPLPERDLLLAKAIVECLDDDGYFRMELDELIDISSLEPPATGNELMIALRRVQSLEPAGVAARNVTECLLLQLCTLESDEDREIARRIIADHIDALASHDVTALARCLDLPASRIEPVCALIRRFDPHPGWRHANTPIQYITPDVMVRKVRGEWTALLNPAIVPRVRLNHLYADLFQRHAGHGNSAMAAHLREARWTIRNVEQRFATILAVAQSIVKRQRAFFEYGVLAMKPLGLREIADEVGVHESTVSRVTNNKYMAAPHGVLELKYFFSRAMTATSGAAFSGTAIRGLVKDMIEAEKPEAPLSDAEITRRLSQQGLVLARRTVTKYRQQLQVAPVELRRRQAAAGEAM